ncbi:MAG TPA: sigma 54-interacting transcriptional regulator [Anaeromyxobacteraceae bacterium]|nr:sigma 54-interacting transcriptional regulator [Anaeromyxobacteraceae bacterium]
MPQPEHEAILRAFLGAAGVERGAFEELIVGATGDGVVVAAADGAVVFANPAARERLGVAPGASLREALPELVPAAERALATREEQPGPLLQRRNASHLTKVTPLRGPVRRDAAGGAQSRDVQDGDLLGVLCAFVDVTAASELSTRQLWAYEELTREQDAIINSTSEGLWICDGDANVLRINPASERLNGIRADQVVGRNMRELVAEGLFDRSATLEVIRTRAPVNMLQSRQGRKLVLTGNPVFDDAGKLIRVVVNERDITEIDGLQRELEEQEAMKDRFRDQMLEMQLETVESRRVIAKSPCMQKALRQAIKVAGVDSTVLVLGESGVGKGLIGDLIHKYSGRAEKPLVKINCGAIPESLVEAELFGYEKGAFTGAQAKGKPGYFELADGGILFLDEIAELPLSSQVKLLRFLEDGHVMRVGGTESRRLDVRVLAATHRDLQAMVEQGAFRLDLYYRLSVIPLAVPPLRERTECILPTLRHYVGLYAERLGVRRRLSRAAIDALLGYPWPGNVRELINLCERLVVMSEAELIDVTDLPPDIVRRAGSAPAPVGWPEEFSLEQAVESTERAILLRARARYGNQAKVARALGVNQSTVARKMKKYGIG